MNGMHDTIRQSDYTAAKNLTVTDMISVSVVIPLPQITIQEKFEFLFSFLSFDPAYHLIISSIEWANK